MLAPGAKNYITPAGAQKLREELQRLVEVTRPELAEASDDPDAKRQLARLDQRIMQLEESLQSAEIVPPPRVRRMSSDSARPSPSEKATEPKLAIASSAWMRRTPSATG